MKQTLYDKLWQAHIVREQSDGNCLIYIDRQLIHEVTSPQAFEGLKTHGRNPWRIKANLAVPEHNVSTLNRSIKADDPMSQIQLEALDKNCQDFSIEQIALDDERQGIVHVMGPEQGFVLPGISIVCGDSHTSTHGAFAALAFGIGTSEVEHVLATQCLWQKKSKNLKIQVDGQLHKGVEAKDMALYIIGQIGTAGGTGHVIEFCGEAVRALSMEGRMTLCNMAIEAGARVGLVAVDDKTIDYVSGRPFAPKGALLKKATDYWRTLKSDEGAVFDKTFVFNGADIKAQVTWGTSPEMVVAIDGSTPETDKQSDTVKEDGVKKALSYMGLSANQKMTDVFVDKVFIGSCTNARFEDLARAAKIVSGQKIADNIKLAMVVPGSGLVRKKAEAQGLDKIFIAAGFQWRYPGCSMCLAMNGDKLESGERCASTSNRNFEGRQGHGGRTHLVSPTTAAKTAIKGHFTI